MLGGVLIRVGDNFQQVVDNNPPSTRFVIAAGVHRLQTVKPKDGMSFVGQPGAVMSGAKVLSSFTTEGNVWVSSGQTQQGWMNAGADLKDGADLENRPEELFFDGVPLRHVTRGEVGPGKWHFDYVADKIYLGNNPAGHMVETSVAPVAFHGEGVRNVVIENLTIRHYANAAQTGAIHGSGTIDWTIRKVDASWNHGVGIHIGPGSHLSYSKLNNNGQLGLRGESFDPDINYGAPMVIEHNEIAHNKRLGYEWGWEGGAMKILHSTGTVLRNNWFHHNIGPGIWFDYDNHATTIQSNLVEDNTHIGIFYEVSYGPTKIRWNTVRRNGAGQGGHMGAGILISNSRDVEISGNAIDRNERGVMLAMAHRETGPDGQLEVANVVVRDNDIRMLTGSTGLLDETGNDAYYTSKGNKFLNNTYRLPDASARVFRWNRTSVISNWQEWKTIGHDTTGTLLGADLEPRIPAGGVTFAAALYGPGG